MHQHSHPVPYTPSEWHLIALCLDNGEHSSGHNASSWACLYILPLYTWHTEILGLSPAMHQTHMGIFICKQTIKNRLGESTLVTGQTWQELR